jgi:ribonuclease HII
LLIAGVDEAGRGALIGPLVVASVILPPFPELKVDFVDSKKIGHKTRESLFLSIKAIALAVSVVAVSPKMIDKLNILEATLFGMRKVVKKLKLEPNVVLIDGNRVPKIDGLPVGCLVKGDSFIPEISAASIVAKVVRDRLMLKYHIRYPDYSFDLHKGYGTFLHYEAILEHGLLPDHRKSFNLTRQGVLF